mmetsp:Transcript_183615/g.582429  ORF Transcript_183615/g.582429 Transcript_183615/m.582429 type:complete len:85 (+) Transcript_183615:39-293(+)
MLGRCREGASCDKRAKFVSCCKWAGHFAPEKQIRLRVLAKNILSNGHLLMAMTSSAHGAVWDPARLPELGAKLGPYMGLSVGLP